MRVSDSYPFPLLIFNPDGSSTLQVRVLTTFYCGKLDDTETIVPSLQGLTTLVKLPQFTSSDALEVVRAFVPTILPYLPHESLIVISRQSVRPRQNEGFNGPSQILSIFDFGHVII